MKIYVASDDARSERLKTLCLQRGHQMPHHGPWNAVVLALPHSTMPEELTDALPRGQCVISGKPDAALEQLAKKRGWRMRYPLQDEAYLLKNAQLTAEGAVYAAMREAPFAISGAKCLVIGYGRIGKALTRMLRALGADVIAAARRPESRLEAGGNSIAIEEIPKVLSSVQLVFNTVPFPLVDRGALTHVPSETLLFELASPPYGIDLAAARELKLHCFLESALPGRYCPDTAAQALLAYIEREESK